MESERGAGFETAQRQADQDFQSNMKKDVYRKSSVSCVSASVVTRNVGSSRVKRRASSRTSPQRPSSASINAPSKSISRPRSSAVT